MKGESTAKFIDLKILNNFSGYNQSITVDLRWSQLFRLEYDPYHPLSHEYQKCNSETEGSWRYAPHCHNHCS